MKCISKPGEEWRDVVGYEGYYKVSNRGRILSLVGWNGHTYVKREKIINGWVQKTHRNKHYKRRVVSLSKDGKKEEWKVHRLVAKAFIENPENYPTINHKDGNPLNNCVGNLEWCDQKQNVQHAYDTGLRRSNIHKYKHEIIKDYEKGLAMRTISKKYKASEISVRELLAKNGLRIRDNSEYRDKYRIDKKELSELFDKGLSNKELATHFNTNTNLIATYRYKNKRGEIV